MITIGRDSTPRVARVGIALVDGKLWSSGTQDRVRAARLRHDPRCTLLVFDAGWSWLALDTTVRILDGPDAPELNQRLFRQMQNRSTGNLSWFGREVSPDEFLRVMVEEGTSVDLRVRDHSWLWNGVKSSRRGRGAAARAPGVSCSGHQRSA